MTHEKPHKRNPSQDHERPWSAPSDYAERETDKVPVAPVDTQDADTEVFKIPNHAQEKIARQAVKIAVESDDAITQPIPVNMFKIPGRQQDDWRHRGEAPPQGTGVNRSTGAKGLNPDRFRKLR